MTELKSRAEMAEELAAILLPTEWFEDKHADGQSPRCCDAVEHITHALARRDEMVMDKAAELIANHIAIWASENTQGREVKSLTALGEAIRALKGKLR